VAIIPVIVAGRRLLHSGYSVDRQFGRLVRMVAPVRYADVITAVDPFRTAQATNDLLDLTLSEHSGAPQRT
jgi:hypothetical protein